MAKKNNKPKTVFDALSVLAKAVEELKSATGLNQRAVILLLHDHTRIPKKTIKAVLDGSLEALEKYTADDEPDDGFEG